jgi:ABC-2 type transport system permease protein
MSSLKLYFRYAAISLRGQMQYRASFLLQSCAQFLITGTEFLGLAAIFQRFKQINGWTLPEVALFYGMISLAFAIAEAVPRGFDTFPRLIRSGDFDRVLLRPRTTGLQILGQELQLMRIGRFSQGLIVLLWATTHLAISWTPAKCGLLLFAVLGGAALFSGLFILSATMAFWTIEALEIVNCSTYGGVEAAQFPLTIYRPWFRHIFTFVVPLATINYFPAHAILGRPDVLGSSALFQWLSPAFGVLFLLATLLFWRIGVRKYQSTGS